MSEEAPAPAAEAAPIEAPAESGANERIRALIAEKKDLATQLEEARALSSQHETALTELRSRYDAEATSWTQERAFLGAGITDADTQEVILARHGKLGEDAPELAAWLADGAKSDPIVSRLLQPSSTDGRRLPPSSAGAQPTPTPATSGTREDYLRQLEAVQRLPKGAQRAEAMASLRAHPWLTGG
jgi:hypothetical protein